MRPNKNQVMPALPVKQVKAGVVLVVQRLRIKQAVRLHNRVMLIQLVLFYIHRRLKQRQQQIVRRSR